jgi:hypothetical protein
MLPGSREEENEERGQRLVAVSVGVKKGLLRRQPQLTQRRRCFFSAQFAFDTCYRC